jgi:hypothetical protein
MNNKTRYLNLAQYKKMSRFRNIRFYPWDENFYSIISTFDTDYIYDSKKEVWIIKT